ncbi:putative allantoicase [Neolecta irregularis DAH-3]|uniref:Putative allantoicase n=1 Tax=Neolecta irregularis (strain DAH-3) TaxID=1198029 RepID=A0A1U7LLU1_NEOID|nr:putative allantoicase [Neolecta irregularis DAH-3]|eukprot:OLL23617.1 putative allantoicase [Neolecta irregularis DAH-3]
MSFEQIDPALADSFFSAQAINLADPLLGAHIHSCSNQFFAPAKNIINPLPPVHKPGVFVKTGAWYDGWESKRHNPQPSDWVIIRLGPPRASILGAQVDTAFFTGNYAPAISIEATCSNNITKTTIWSEVIPYTPCGPSQRHFYRLTSPSTTPYTHVRLQMYPDGGIARFRLYGHVVPLFPPSSSKIDLASVLMGAIAVSCSDQHYGQKHHLLLPGRGLHMGHGWETRRSRSENHSDWVVVKLGASGYLSHAQIDTLHFRGNYPTELFLLATNSHDLIPKDDTDWTQILPPQKMGPDYLKSYPLTHTNIPFTHMVIVPDGGVKRLRIFGKRALTQSKL